MVSRPFPQYDRYTLEQDVYEIHKPAYGVKGRHYDFDNMHHQGPKMSMSSFVRSHLMNMSVNRSFT